MSVQSEIQTRLTNSLEPTLLQVENESFMHNVPEGSETHFRVVVVSGGFVGLARVGRHRKVNEVLKDLLAGPIHALSIKAYTPEEWTKMDEKDISASPKCQGGSIPS